MVWLGESINYGNYGRVFTGLWGDRKICGWGIGLPGKVYLGSAIRGNR